jgi:hypothetical protein
MIREGRLYEGLGEQETYYLTQLLIDLFDELVESEAVSEEIPLDALDQALGPLRTGDSRVVNAGRWLTRGRLLGTERTVAGERADEIEMPYFGYVLRDELPALIAALTAAPAPGRPPRGSRRGRASGVLEQLTSACREALETERDLLGLVG